MTCLVCNHPLTLGTYRLVAIQREGEAWRSRYACRGACTEQALGKEQCPVAEVEQNEEGVAHPQPETTS